MVNTGGKGAIFSEISVRFVPRPPIALRSGRPFESAAEFLIILDLIQQSFVSSRSEDSTSPYPPIALTT
jgi:hypothetical protein